jgi:hypothetical protein
VRSLVGGEDDDDDDEAGLERKRRTPFMLMGTGKNDVLAQPTAGYKTALKGTIKRSRSTRERQQAEDEQRHIRHFGQAERPATACLRSDILRRLLLYSPSSRDTML